jgi:SAM-dependent methyltransferase
MSERPTDQPSGTSPLLAGLLDGVTRYYTARFEAHGATPQGVDWNSGESQRKRFDQCARLWEGRTRFSLNDFGCGYGALLDYLVERKLDVDYLGVDVSEAMIEEANARMAGRRNCSFVRSSIPPRVADFTVASGLFNVKLDAVATAWLDYMLAMLGEMDRTSASGFGFNCLTKYSDPERMRRDLYYADPAFLFDYCKTRFARNVALLHDYDLYEFTILVRKTPR